MVRKIAFLVVLIFCISGCKRQLVQIGLVDLDRESILRTKKANWRSLQTENVETYIEFHLQAERDEVIDDINDAYEDISQLFHPSDIQREIYLFLVSGEKIIQKITGFKEKMQVYPQDSLIIMVINESREDEFEMALAQLAAVNLWGPTQGWLQLGFGKYASQAEEESNDLHRAASDILSASDLSLADIITNYSKMDGKEAPVLLGSFLKFMIEAKGINFLKAIWRTEIAIDNNKIALWDKEWKDMLINNKGE